MTVIDAHSRFCRQIASTPRRILGQTVHEIENSVTSEPIVYKSATQFFPLPFIIDGSDWLLWKSTSERFVDLIRRFVEAELWRRGDSFVADIGMPEALIDLAQKVSASPRTPTLLARPDFVLGEHGPLFLEANIDSSLGGLGTADSLASCQSASALTGPLFKENSLVYPAVSPKLARLVLATARPKACPITMAIIDWRDEIDSVPWPYWRLADDLSPHGITTVLAGQDDIEFRHGQLLAADRPIDLIYRGVTPVQRLWEGAAAFESLWTAVASQQVSMMSDLWAPLYSSKAVLALLSAALDDSQLPPDDAEFVRRHIPWTRLLRDAACRRDGASIDLLEHARRRKDQLVIKSPLDGSCKNLVIGRTSDQAGWERALRAALCAPGYVLQEYVAPTCLLNVDPSRDPEQLCHFRCVFSVFTFGGHATGTCIRGRADAGELISCEHGAREGIAFVSGES